MATAPGPVLAWATLARLPARARLLAAAALSLVPLGLPWATSAGIFNPGYTIYGSCSYTTSGYCTPDMRVYSSFVPGRTSMVMDSPLRVFLVLAALVLLVAAVHRRTRGTLALVRGATLGLTWVVLSALSHGSLPVLALSVLALILAAPLAWRSRPRGVLAPRELAG